MSELRQWLKENKHRRSPWGEKLDSNGYAKSLFETRVGECFLCGYHGDTVRHEVFYGTADRKTSKAVGLWLDLCPRCHEVAHRDPKYFHELGQRLFEHIYSHDEFMELYGKSYL